MLLYCIQSCQEASLEPGALLRMAFNGLSDRYNGPVTAYDAET